MPAETIVIDTREQRPYGTKGGYDVVTVRHALAVGDYALLADCAIPADGTAYKPTRAVERKSVADFISSWMLPGPRSRELAKLIRARQLRCIVAYVVDGDEAAIARYPYRKRFKGKAATAASVMGYVHSLRAKGFPVLLCADKRAAAKAAYGWLMREGAECNPQS